MHMSSWEEKPRAEVAAGHTVIVSDSVMIVSDSVMIVTLTMLHETNAHETNAQEDGAGCHTS